MYVQTVYPQTLVCIFIHLGTKGPGYGRWYLLIEDLRAFGAVPFLAGEKTPALQSVLESVYRTNSH